MDDVVVDASAFVDLLLADELGRVVGTRLDGTVWHAPSHVDAEVLSALGRLHRGGLLDADQVGDRLRSMTTAPVRRHSVDDLLLGAWSRRHRLRLVDGLYVELAERLRCRLVTTDRRLRNEHCVDVAEI